MATLTVQDTANTGLNATYTAATAAGDEFANDGNTILHVKNGSGGSLTVTVATTQTVEGLSVSDAAIVIPDTEERFIGPFAVRTFGGTVGVTYSTDTSVTVAVLKVARAN